MVAATRRAPGPMNRQWVHPCTHLFLESLGKGDSAALRFDKSQIAIIGSDAGNQSAHKRRRTRRELLEQRFPEKLRHAIGSNIGDNCILSRSQANLAVAIDVCEPRELVQLFGINSSGWNA